MNFTQKGVLSLVGKFTSSILALLLSIILARYLGVKGVGQYQVILSSQTIAITVLAMGFGNASIYFINSEKISRKEIVSNLSKLFFIVGIILIVFLASIMLYYKNYFGQLKVSSVIIFSLGVSALLLYNILMPVLYANLEVLKLQVLNLSSTVFILISLMLLQYLRGININLAIAVVGISNIITTIILFYFLRHDFNYGLKTDFVLLKRLFFFGIKISAANLAFILSSNIVIFLLKELTVDGFASVGLFSRATAIANIFLILPITLGTLFYSKWSGMEKIKLKKEVEFTLRILILLTSICAVFTIFFGKYILFFLYGKEFERAASALSILSFSIVFSSVTIILTNVFASLGKPSITLKVFIFSLIITCIASLFLIPKFEIEGAAISVTVGLLFNTLTLFYLGKKSLNISIINSLLFNITDFRKLLTTLKIQ